MVSRVVYFNQIGLLDSINASGSDDAIVDISSLFPAGSSIEVVFDDADFDANGNLITNAGDIFIDLIITESNGNVITISDIKLDLAPERIGDTYVSTADAVTFTDSDGVFYDSQIIIVTSGTLSVGNNQIIPGNTNSDPDTNFNICFEGSTLIETEKGLKQARDIRAGDRVVVLDGCAAPVLWASCKPHSIDLMRQGQLPVLIKAGSLGSDLPVRDTMLSGQHRVLVGTLGQVSDRGLEEGIVAAKALTVLPKIRYARGKTKIEWCNFAFAKHELVKANGAWMESLLLGPEAMKTFSPEEIQELHVIFPEPGIADTALNGRPARKILKVRAVLRHLRKSRSGAPGHPENGIKPHALSL